MSTWLRAVLGDVRDLSLHLWSILVRGSTPSHERDRTFRLWGQASAAVFVGIALLVVAFTSFDLRVTDIPTLESEPLVDYTLPVRAEPKRFKANSYLPRKHEGRAAGSIVPGTFSPKYDLILVDDDRVWWESDHDKNDTENDHQMHWAVQDPFRRLVELVVREDALLKVQDAYRVEGIHASRSLHKEGRALDLTAEGVSLEKLAKLCWAAGFDWVYYESPKRGGAHIHCSVRATRD